MDSYKSDGLMSLWVDGLLQVWWTDVTVGVDGLLQVWWTDITVGVDGLLQVWWTDVTVGVDGLLQVWWTDVTVGRGVAWIFEVVRRILIVCDWTITGRRPVRDACGVARGWSGGGRHPPPQKKKTKLDL